MRHEGEVEIAAPAEEVWRTLLDVERWPEWSESMERVARLDDGPLRVGSEARVKQPRLREMTWRVTVLEPRADFTWVTTSPGLLITARHLFEPRGATACAVRLVVEMQGPLVPLARLLAGGTLRRYVGCEAAGLKRRCEASL